MLDSAIPRAGGCQLWIAARGENRGELAVDLAGDVPPAIDKRRVHLDGGRACLQQRERLISSEYAARGFDRQTAMHVFRDFARDTYGVVGTWAAREKYLAHGVSLLDSLSRASYAYLPAHYSV